MPDACENTRLSKKFKSKACMAAGTKNKNLNAADKNSSKNFQVSILVKKTVITIWAVLRWVNFVL